MASVKGPGTDKTPAREPLLPIIGGHGKSRDVKQTNYGKNSAILSLQSIFKRTVTALSSICEDDKFRIKR